MSTIKINSKEYHIKSQDVEITLMDYLDIVDILNKDQYNTYVDKQGNIKTRREPIPKEQRTEQFIEGLYKEVIQRISNIPLKYLNEEEVLSYLLELIKPAFDNIINLPLNLTDEELESKIFISEDVNYKFTPFHKWTFDKWCALEFYLTNGVKDIDEISSEIKIKIKGDRMILPICFDFEGNFDNQLIDLDVKTDFFLIKLSVIETLPYYHHIFKIIESIKKSHSFLYGSGGSSDSSSQSLAKHNESFGWIDTMRGLAEKAVFGNYLQVKKAPLFEVLEYLNCSISRDSAEIEDMKNKPK